MRAAFLALAMLLFAPRMEAFGQHGADAPPVEIGFKAIRGGNIIRLTDSVYVYRDTASWNEHFVPQWPNVLGPPPRPTFSDSLVIGLGYGMTACYETGGEIESITASDTAVVVHISHVYALMPVCLAEVPRSIFYMVATADLPPDVEFSFDRAQPPYEDLLPREWFPLEVGNAWHYGAGYPDRIEWVEFVEASVQHEQQTWFRIATAYCSVDPCERPSERHLRWTDDHYLLSADAALQNIDTVLATQPRSIFTVNVPTDTSLTIRDERVRAGIYVYNFDPFYRYRMLMAEPCGGTWFIYGVGPVEWPSEHLMAALIRGEHHEDTSLIMTALNTSPQANIPERITIDVYPHPSNERTVLSFTPGQTGTAHVLLFDVLGRSVLELTENVTAGTIWQFPLSRAGTLAPGLYLIRATGADGRAVERTMIVIE